jgi:AAA+ ATPase superfamily predicted ATPase
MVDLVRKREITVPFPIGEVKRWWYKDKEIDVVALNSETKEILFAECKWKNNMHAEKVLVNLKEKTKYVNWFNSTRKEYFAVFGKSFSRKEGICFDLKDLEEVMNKRE